MDDTTLGAILGSGSVVDEAEELLRRIDQSVEFFVHDNYHNPSPRDFLVIKNAMLIGATIKGEVQMDFEAKKDGRL